MMKMPRGKTARTRKRMAKAEEAGKVSARLDSEAKTFSSSKQFIVWLKDVLEKHIDKVPKLIAYIGTTILVKKAIDASEALTTEVLKIVTKGEISGTTQILLALATPMNPFLSLFPWVAPLFPSLLPEGVEQVPEVVEKGFESLPLEGLEWLISFAIAYIIVEHGGQIALGIGDAVKNITGMVGFFLGL
jgi:hypothetical protein